MKKWNRKSIVTIIAILTLFRKLKWYVVEEKEREIRLIVFKLQLILRDIKSSRIFQRRRKRYPTTFPFFFFSFMPVLRIIRQNDVEEKKYTKIIEDGQSAVSCLTQTVAELPLIIWCRKDWRFLAINSSFSSLPQRDTTGENN